MPKRLVLISATDFAQLACEPFQWNSDCNA